MGLLGALEVHLQFHSLRNIDLFHQGVYQVRAQVYRELQRGEPLISGIPTRISLNPLETDAVTQKDNHCLAPAFINEANRTFSTRSFQVRYCEEEIEINDGIVFRLEVDLTRPVSYSAPIYIEMDLMYAESRRKSQQVKNGGGDFLASPLRGGDPPEPNEVFDADFVDAACQVFRVQNPVQGVAEYFQTTFDHLHCCVVHCTVITAITDIRDLGRSFALPPVLPPRFNVPKPAPSLTYSKKTPEKVLPIETGGTPTGNDGYLEKDPLSLRPQSVSLIEYLTDTVRNLELAEVNDGPRNDLIWAEVRGPPRVRDASETVNVIVSRCDLVYHEHITLLIRTYFRLRAHLTTIVFRCLSEAEEKDLSWLRAEGPFLLPGRHSVATQPNGLPEPPSLQNPTKFRKVTFSIPAHLCADVADEVFGRSENVSIAGATRQVTVSYLPPSARLPRPRSANDPALGSILQHILIEDFNLIWRQTHEVWNKLRTLCAIAHREVMFFHRLIWEKRLSARCKEVIYLEVLAARNPCQPVEPDLGLVHAQLAEDLRQSQKFHDLPSLPVEDVHDTFDIQSHPIMFEERYAQTEDESIGRGFMERRNRLSSIHGGLAESIPEGTTRAVSRQPILHSTVDDAVLRGRSAEAAPPFQGLKTLAYMKQAAGAEEEENTTTLNRELSSSTAEDSRDEDSLAPPADEDVQISLADSRFLKVSCPIFQDIPSAPKLYRGTHLIVFVHGFQGNSMDMRLLRNQLSLIFPEALYLSSSANEEFTEGDISVMGKRLAEEITSYVTDLCPSESIGRVSIIAHSLGGTIARAALPHLECFADKFHLLLTLSSPHLGYTFARNRLVDAGLWVLKKWKKSASLQQLSFGDSKSARDTLLYKMSTYDNLKWFQHVVLVSCIQDQYIPYESARIEISDKIRSDPTWGNIHTEMVHNLLRNVHKEKIIRLDVCFKIADTRSLDSLIGRTAHIQFLGSSQLAQMLVMTYPHWFA